MPTKVVMEALSPTMEEGRLVKWLKNEGDAVKTGDVLAEVETDKAVMELAARGEGVLRKRLIGEGEAAPVGQLIAVIAGADENIDDIVGDTETKAKPAEAATPAGPKEAKEAKEEKEEKEGEEEKEEEEPAAEESGERAARPETAAKSDDQGRRKQDDWVRAEDKAWRSSIPQEAGEEQGEASMPHQARDRRGDARYQPRPAAPRPRGNGAEARQQERVKSSPLARRLASDRGVELGEVQGSGPGGRIVRRDIEAAAEQPAGARREERAAAPAPRPDADYEDVPLSQMRKAIARRLAESIGPIPTFYLTAEYDMERVAEMRSAMTELGDEYKVSFNDIVLKAVATALTLHPEVNSHWLGDKMRRYYRVHLGLAVAVEDGLITPVIFDADRKRLSEIAAEARELAQRARDRKLKPDEYTGATFTVSNLGMFGIEHFTAIINPPEGGILAVGAMEEKAVVLGGEVTARRRMRVTMSCDHRVIDGATGAVFLQTLRRMLENPLMLVY